MDTICKYCNESYSYKSYFKFKNICYNCYNKYLCLCIKCHKRFLSKKNKYNILCKKCNTTHKHKCHSCSITLINIENKFSICNKLFCYNCTKMLTLLSPNIKEIVKELSSLKVAILLSKKELIFPNEIFNEINKYIYNINRYIITFNVNYVESFDGYESDPYNLVYAKLEYEYLIIVDTCLLPSQIVDIMNLQKVHCVYEQGDYPLYVDIEINKYTYKLYTKIQNNNKFKHNLKLDVYDKLPI